MAARVVGQQAVHDLRGGGDQHAVAGQGGRQRVGGGEAVLTVLRVDIGIDTAPPRVPDYLAHLGRALHLPGQAGAPRVFQRGNRAVVQRRRPQGRQVVEVLHAERHAHREVPMFMFLTCQYRHVIRMNTFCLLYFINC